MKKTIRDLVHRVHTDHSDIRDLVHSMPQVDSGRTPAEERARVALPGDSVEGISNPYVGKNPQTVLHLLQSGTLPPDQEILAREAVAIFDGFSGDYLTGGIERSVPISKKGPSARAVDEDVAQNPDFDPEIANLFR